MLAKKNDEITKLRELYSANIKTLNSKIETFTDRIETYEKIKEDFVTVGEQAPFEFNHMIDSYNSILRDMSDNEKYEINLNFYNFAHDDLNKALKYFNNFADLKSKKKIVRYDEYKNSNNSNLSGILEKNMDDELINQLSNIDLFSGKSTHNFNLNINNLNNRFKKNLHSNFDMKFDDNNQNNKCVTYQNNSSDRYLKFNKYSSSEPGLIRAFGLGSGGAVSGKNDNSSRNVYNTNSYNNASGQKITDHLALLNKYIIPKRNKINIK